MKETSHDTQAKDTQAKAEQRLRQQVGSKVARKLHTRRSSSQGVWFGLGMMGLIGWSVSVPTLLGAAVGLWLDRHYPEGRSYTLVLLVAGLTMGCWNAWHWVTREGRAVHEEEQEERDHE